MKEAIDMYNNAGKWEEAHRLASTCMKREEVAGLYIRQAQKLESEGRFRDAERSVFGFFVVAGFRLSVLDHDKCLLHS